MAERASDDPERKMAAPNAKGIAERSLAFGQLLDSKDSERTERRNAGSFCSGGRRVTLAAGHGGFGHPTEVPGSLIGCSIFPDPVTQIPCSGASNSLIQFPVMASAHPQASGPDA
ncbi:MAG: hypothetical protein AB7F22_36760 [Reyranella sp.]|uniref:hypothetical protein n=1 Tax=Reyranella sp. TaxID=1929291 RepID=UPI003D0FF6FB